MTTFEDIVRAGEQIRTTDIKGKAYAQVPERVKAFRMLHPEGRIVTEIVSFEGKRIMMRATVMTKEGHILATGTAFEDQDSSFINKTSFIENCETSAVGRALGLCGFGIDVAIASAEEVQTAIDQQEEGTPLPTNYEKALDFCKEHRLRNSEFGLLVRKAKAEDIVPDKQVNDMTKDEFERLLAWVSIQIGV